MVQARLLIWLVLLPSFTCVKQIRRGKGTRNYKCAPILCDDSRGHPPRAPYPADPEKCESDCSYVVTGGRIENYCMGYRWLRNAVDNKTTCTLYGFDFNGPKRRAPCESGGSITQLSPGTGETCLLACADFVLENGVVEYSPPYEISPVDMMVATFKCDPGYRLEGCTKSLPPLRCLVYLWVPICRNAECIPETTNPDEITTEVPSLIINEASLSWAELKERAAVSVRTCHIRCKQLIPSIVLQLSLEYCEQILNAQFYAQLENCLTFNGAFIITDEVPCWVHPHYGTSVAVSSNTEWLRVTGLDAYYACFNVCNQFMVLQVTEGCVTADELGQLAHVNESCGQATEEVLPQLARSFYVPCMLATLS